MSGPVHLERDGGLAVVTFSSPPLNLFDALACDLILAAESAQFGLVEAVIGLTPAMGGTQRLVERAGTGRARELVMTGVPYDARVLGAGAWSTGCCPMRALTRPHTALPAACRGPHAGHAATEGVLRAYLDGGLEHANDRVSQIAGALFDTDDLKGAVRSFLEEGRPGKATFRGR